MGFLFRALLNSAWTDYFKKLFKLTDYTDDALLADTPPAGADASAVTAWKASSQTLNIVTLVLWIILAVVGVAGVIYSIYLGVKLARAEDQSKRDEAKKHLITVVIAIVVTLVLVVFFNTLLPLILSAVRG